MEDKFDGFTVNLYLDEDGDWIAHFLELPICHKLSKNRDCQALF
jgi:predicted RNase H-like HicB family nuclease